jgi:hypothetical protein
VPLVLAVVAYAHTLGYPFVNWDDPSHFLQSPLAEHPLARGWSGLFATKDIGYPAPLLLLSFALDRRLFGLAPMPYHAENLALHLANVAMLVAIARRMRLSRLEACAVGVLFAVHPLIAEPVSWVTGRKDVLSTAMVLGACLFASGGRGVRRWVLADVLAALAVLVLPRMVVAPILVAIVAWGIHPEWKLGRTLLRTAPALPFSLAVIAAGARQLTSLGGTTARGWHDVLLDAAGAWALQLGHLIAPVALQSYYVRVAGDPPVWAMVAAAAALLVVAWLAVTRLPSDSPARAGLLFALVAYAPVSCVVRIPRWTADSYMYMPIAGLSLAVVPLVARAWPVRLRVFGLAAAAASAAILVLLCFVATTRWRSSTDVWAGSIQRYPNEPLSYEHEALGMIWDGRVDEGNAVMRTLADRFPDWEDTLDDEVRAFEAVGDEAHARERIAHGVRVGNAGCVRMFWLRLLASRTPPSPGEKDLVATAFHEGFEPMKAGVHDPAVFRRVARILHGLGLDDEASQAARHAESLSGAP